MLDALGYATHAAKAPLSPYKFQRRDPRARDIVIDIKYCGICHSDIHQARDEWGRANFPMVPGHEITGVVTQVGAKVTKYKVGDKVGVGCFVDSCRVCDCCKKGFEQFCSNGASFTYNGLEQDKKTPTMGGYSTVLTVDEDYALRIPANLPLAAAAPLLCAGITTYSPLNRWKAGPGKKVAMIGLGGLGHMGVKIAHAMGAEVTVLSHSPKKEADAKRLGADHFYATADPEIFASLQGAFDLILCTVSTGIDWNQYLNLLKIDGAMVLLGIPDKDVPVGARSLIMGRRILTGSLIGGISETQEMLDFCGKHNITSDIELISADKINEAYDRVMKSDVRYRFVIDIATLKAA
ncbi:MAG: NAD(P)-dependent alcohol dehydrogenase [Alphaproteobacteria bacterium]|nr:NAD(P)-dependent alcohol dehydrogenase [Alphaproteobacteria bacterium]